MNKKKLSRDLSKVIITLDEIKVRYGLITGPDDMPTAIDKAYDLLKSAYIDALIDETIK